MEPMHTRFRTAARFVEKGWVQNRWRDSDGNVCLLQAVMSAMGIKESRDIPVGALVHIDAQLATTGTYCRGRQMARKRRRAVKRRNHEDLIRLIYGWNDAEGRTAHEVAVVLRAVADRYEELYRPHLREIISRAIRPVKGYSASSRRRYDALEV